MKCTSRLQAVELGDDDRRAVQARVLDGALELRAALQRVGALAGLDLLEGRDERDPFLLAEAGDGVALRIEADVAAPAALAVFASSFERRR